MIILVLLSLVLSCIENDYIIDQQSIVLIEELHKEILILKKEQKQLLELLKKT